MSGGHYDYAYHKVSDFAYSCTLPRRSWDYKTQQDVEVPVDNLELRQRFAAHLEKVAEVMREIEWCDSGDTGEEEMRAKLEEFLSTLKE